MAGLTITYSLLILYTLPSSNAWYKMDMALDISYLETLYEGALNGQLVSAAQYKDVQVTSGSSCKATEQYCINSIKYMPDFEQLKTEFECNSTISCTEGCLTPADIDFKPISGLKDRELLDTGEDVVRRNLPVATYVISLSLKDLHTEQAVDVLKISLASGDQQAMNMTLTFRSMDAAGSITLNNTSPSKTESIPNEKLDNVQIAIMTYNDTETTGILINGKHIYGRRDSLLASLALNTAKRNKTVVRDYKVYDRLVTTQELIKLLHGDEDVEILPEPACGCPADLHPIFKEWPHVYENDAKLYGMQCKSLTGDTVYRVPETVHHASFVTDDNKNTFWMSSKGEKLSKLTLDLGTVYQVIMGTMALQSFPKYLVITKSLTKDGDEEILYVISPQCDDEPLPSELGLPDSKTPMKCEPHSTVNLFQEGDIGEIILDWSYSLYYENANDYIGDPQRFLRELNSGRAEARYINIYLYDFHAGAEQHIVNELEIFGSCGCSSSGICSLNHQTSRKKRDAAEIFAKPIKTTSLKPWTFADVHHFTCNCFNNTKGDLCDLCADDSYKSGYGCEPCGCLNGSLSQSCDSEGKCDCNSPGHGDLLDFANDKCSPFVSEIIPTYGPVAGGTKITVIGAWLNSVDNIPGLKCGDSKRNQTYRICKTENVDQPGVTMVSIPDTAPLANFTYKPNPNITSIGKNKVFKRGGLRIPVFGTNLDSIYQPQMKVSVSCRDGVTTDETFNSSCVVKSSSKMECISPNFERITKDIRCRNPPRQKRDVSQPLKTYKFNIGFVLDGFTEFSNISKVPWLKASAEIYVYPDPEVSVFPESDRIRVLDKDTQILEIYGENLQSGAELDDYTVEVGMGRCEVTRLLNNLLLCTIPNPLPDPDKGHFKLKHEKEIPAVVVRVGSLETACGYLMYQEDDNSLTVILLGVLVPIFVIAVATVVILLLLKSRRKAIFKKQGYPEKAHSRYVAGPRGRAILLGQNGCLDSDYMKELKAWIIPKNYLELSTPLGQGQFGKVFLGSLKMKSGMQKKVAVKTLKAELLATDPNAVTNFLQEAILMKDFCHPNVLSLIGVALNNEQLPMVITHFMAKGDLKHVLKDDSLEFTVGDLIHLALQVAYGMEYLSKRKFIHRDLAARNCMVDEQFFVKVADFGLSHSIYSEDYYRVQDKAKPLPVKWMAIESLTAGKYTTESDVWSYGVLLWEILTRGASPYPGVNNYEIKEHLKIGQRLSQPEYCPDELYDLMCECWNLEPTERPTFGEVSEMLSAYKDDDNDYERVQTKQIEDDYYLQPVTTDDRPVYENDEEFEPEDKFEEANKKIDDVDTHYDSVVPIKTLSPSFSVDNGYDTPEDVKLNTNNSNNTSADEELREIHVHVEDYLTPRKSKDIHRLSNGQEEYIEVF